MHGLYPGLAGSGEASPERTAISTKVASVKTLIDAGLISRKRRMNR